LPFDGLRERKSSAVSTSHCHDFEWREAEGRESGLEIVAFFEIVPVTSRTTCPIA
jgi:hypothetical protein